MSNMARTAHNSKEGIVNTKQKWNQMWEHALTCYKQFKSSPPSSV